METFTLGKCQQAALILELVINRDRKFMNSVLLIKMPRLGADPPSVHPQKKTVY